MKKTFFLLLTIGILLPIYSFGQAPPGYLGKRASVSFNFSALPALVGPTKKNRGIYDTDDIDRDGNIGLNYAFEIKFDYVLNRYKSLGLTLGRYSTNALIEGLETEQEVSGRDDFDVFARLNVTSVSLVWNRFSRKRGGLAPMGNYSYFGIKRNFVRGKMSSYDDPQVNDDLDFENLGVDNTKTGLTYFLYGWGNNQMIKEKILLKSGFHLAIPLNFKYIGELGESTRIGSSSVDFDNDYYYEINVAKRIALHELFRFEIGIGYLIF